MPAYTGFVRLFYVNNMSLNKQKEDWTDWESLSLLLATEFLSQDWNKNLVMKVMHCKLNGKIIDNRVAFHGLNR